MNLYVNSSNYATIEAALSAAKEYSEPVTIYIAPGTYRENLTINQHNLTLIGEGADPADTVIVFGHYALEMFDDQNKRGTFRSHSVFIDCDHFTATNLTFANDAGPGDKVGQAVAVNADGDFITYKNCRFLGYQDTIFTGPLPPKELQPGGFLGPKQVAPRRPGRQLFENCYIEGTVDFIFGGAAAYFDNCHIHSLAVKEGHSTYYTAASTPEGQKFGYVFNNCKFTGELEGNTYLGRPWRDFAKTVIMNSYLSESIHPQHWHDWNKPAAHSTMFYAEYNNNGPGSDLSNIPDYVHILSDSEALEYTKDNLLTSL